MRFFVPFDAQTPKTRLAPVLDTAERSAFARAMCEDVLAAVRAAGHSPELLATDDIDVDAPVTVDDRSLSPAVNAALADADLPVGIVVADLPLATADAIERLLSPSAAVSLAPGLGGGTNALVVDDGDFRVDFHGGSYRNHRWIANDSGLTVATVDSFRLAVDVDRPSDLPEVLLHSEGHAAEWLRGAGFHLDETGDRTSLNREGAD